MCIRDSLYAGLCAAASFGMGSMVQANAISETLEFSFSMPPVLIGGLLVLLSGRIMAGGAGAIAGAAEKMVQMCIRDSPFLPRLGKGLRMPLRPGQSLRPPV